MRELNSDHRTVAANADTQHEVLRQLANYLEENAGVQAVALSLDLVWDDNTYELVATVI